MEKVCEYCKVLRPVVHCKADSANLCLPCDVKIHSANALSNRHSRTLLCELCRCHWAYIKCSNHHMFMCRTCDRSQHNVLSQHLRRVISSYIGCPSAMDLAELWGFDLNCVDDSTRQDQSISTTGEYVNSGAVNCNTLMQSCPQAGGSSIVSEVESVTSQSVLEDELRSNRKHAKEIYKGTPQRNICFILQQVLDLNRIQLSDGTNSSSSVRCREQTDMSISENESTWELENKLDQHLQYSFGLDSDLQQTGSTNTGLHVDSFPSPFSQLDPLTTSTGESPMEVDSIWQSKTPDQSGQLWSQNMQDLGVCEELGCLDELSMPDIDLTFRNFEELFGGGEHEQTRLPDDRYTACAPMENDVSFDKPEYGCASGMKDRVQKEDKGTSYKEEESQKRYDEQVVYSFGKLEDHVWKAGKRRTRKGI